MVVESKSRVEAIESLGPESSHDTTCSDSTFTFYITLHRVKMTGKGKEKEKPFASLLAGATAGGVESFITYPFESLKTQLQFGALNGDKVISPHYHNMELMKANEPISDASADTCSEGFKRVICWLFSCCCWKCSQGGSEVYDI